MNTKPGKRSVSHPTKVVAAFLALLLVASGLALAVAPASPAAAATASADAGTVVDGELVWGVKESFRDYVVSPIAHGEIDAADGATQAPDNGVFTFPAVAGAGAVDLPEAVSEFGGSVHFKGHEEDGVPLLDLLIRNIHVFVDDVEGLLVADVSSRPFDPEAQEPPDPIFYEDVILASLDLEGITPIENLEDQSLTWQDVPAFLTEEGVEPFADFYPADTELDPITFTLEIATASIDVVPSDNIDPVGTTTVTVTGSVFDPDSNISTRPPVPVGMPTGVYVVFGRFDDVWKPSDGAPSSARKVIDQKWALPAESKEAVEEAFPQACANQCILLEEDGTFETTLELSVEDLITGNYGVYTYAAGGADPNPYQEIFLPISFEQLFTDIPQDHPFFGSISWLAESGITTGFEDDTYRGDLEITRQAMAAFLWRMAGEPEPPLGHPTFPDVPESNPFYDAISWLAAEGITTGFDDGEFKPQGFVTRQAMAAFLWRDAGEPEPAEDHPTFVDVPESNEFYEAISWLAGVGITKGFDDDTFRPGADITRQAMAAFLDRYAHLSVEEA